MKILKTTKLSGMASGVNFLVLIELEEKKYTGFGKTKDEAVEAAKLHALKPSKGRSRTDRFFDRKR